MKDLAMREYPPEIAYGSMREYIDAVCYGDGEFGKCKTQVEEAFLFGLCHALKSYSGKSINYLNGPFLVKPQKLVGRGAEWYRVGFVISECIPAYEDVKTDSDCEGDVIIECGGEADVERDRRILELTGIPTIRFTEREVFVDPIKCAADAIRILHEITNQKRKYFRQGKVFADNDFDSDE